MHDKYIIEFILTCVFLIWGFLLNDPTYFIASGLFAVAMQIGLWRSDNNA